MPTKTLPTLDPRLHTLPALPPPPVVLLPRQPARTAPEATSDLGDLDNSRTVGRSREGRIGGGGRHVR